MELHNIHKVESTIHVVKITLLNGVVLDISSNENYFHLNFSGSDIPVKSSMSKWLSPPKDVLYTSNIMDIEYKPTGYNHEDYRTGKNS